MDGKLFWGQYLIWVILLLGQLRGCKSCIQKERSALLELKKFLVSRSAEGYSDYVLTSWTNDTKSDCCQWEGIECNRTSTRVIGLSVGFMVFQEYSFLNLSLLHPFEEVRSLDLSSGNQYSENEFFNQFNGFFDDVQGYQSLRTLKNLEILNLSSNRFNNSIFPYLNAATSLTTLFLRSNIMKGPFPYQDLTHLKKLKALDLGWNKFSSSGLQELSNLTNLEVLGLGDNDLDGPTPIEVICKMKNLRELYLSGNHFVGQLPLCLGSLNKLQVLDLSSNHFSGNLPSNFSSLEVLEYLSLLENDFTGLFSLNPLANFTKLEVLKLSSTSDMVQVKTEGSWKPKFQLSVVVLRSCNLEKIPSFLVYQKNLRLVDLSSNRLSGDIPAWLFVNNAKLKVLQLQDNSFTTLQMPTVMHGLKLLDFSANDIRLFPDNISRALPNMIHMNGSKNGFRGHFPSSLGDLKKIKFIDLSYNNFSGKLPRSFLMSCFSLEYLKLSHNKFGGQFLPKGTNFTSMEVLRMDNNNFTGKIGVGLLSSNNTLRALDVSNNCLIGIIPSWISAISYLDILSVSNNFLQGTIPPSLMNISFLDMSGNLLSGALPSYSPSSKLFLHNNNFTGVIPDTLLNDRVTILDLRNNKISGSIPQFVNTESIRILLLSGNKLTGSIPRQMCDLSNIEILDLSDNKLKGFIPSCLNNLSFGRREESSYNYLSATTEILQLEFYKSTFMVDELEVYYFTFQEIEIKFAMKQRYDSYFGGSGFAKGILDYLNGMDLSSNKLSGVIPVELGDLSELHALNLSHNFLSSSIPSSFSKLKDIESLDLSHNMLQGSIPQQLTSLDFLGVLDVSYNNLSGIIPQGRHFDTFDESSYLGNPFLCGPPTDRSCDAKKSSEEEGNGREDEDDEAAFDMVVFYYSTASTYVTALIGVLALMCFDCPWRRAWLLIVDASIASAKSMFS
ncbi:PREDICTED: LRR receptor-like serine/threonine-protein kinase GSO1 isoform X2 [Camelina sativa]|uniref:LRR receptor-like serine/threonine-protein kinase GSO1 isoform X2 n=1 Tax=Camelina sativa TaxID=90675 RepID=A0ABM1R3V5_CAMSA|nr:PREDICTED: LRR receptor-like serine/threonine-protein kinase GSO1 isoform X2 [Camelina sativa]